MSEKAKVQEQTLKDCFIITPIGAPNSETFKSAHGLIQTVLSPVLMEFGYNALPAYKINAAGSITKQVIEHVVNDELVIANLTGLNPNVMYELALRHAYKKKVVTLAESGTSLPFDISDQRTIFYEDNFHGTIALKDSLRAYIKVILESDVTSNPVIDSIKEAAVISAASEEPDGFKYLLNRFDRLERVVMQVANDNNGILKNTYAGILANPIDKQIFEIAWPGEMSNKDFHQTVSEIAHACKVSLSKISHLNEGMVSITFTGPLSNRDSFIAELFNTFPVTT